MAHVVLSEAVEGDSKKPRQGIKDSSSSSSTKEEALGEARKKVELERRKARDGEIAKKRLRVLAASQAKQRGWSEQQTMDALDQINKMSPEQALSNLDLHLAKAEAGFADKMAISIRDGVGTILDRLLRANGCIASRFRSDHALLSALTDELGYVATFVSNKAVIALSAASDVVGGYQDSVLESKNEALKEREEEKIFHHPPLTEEYAPAPVMQAMQAMQETGGKKKKKEKKERKKQCLKIQIPNLAQAQAKTQEVKEEDEEALDLTQSPTLSSPLRVNS